MTITQRISHLLKNMKFYINEYLVIIIKINAKYQHYCNHFLLKL